MPEFKSEPVRVEQHVSEPYEKLDAAVPGDELYLVFEEDNAPCPWKLRGEIDEASTQLLDDYRTEIRKYQVDVNTDEFTQLTLRVRYDRVTGDGHLRDFVSVVTPPFSELQHRPINEWRRLQINPR